MLQINLSQCSVHLTKPHIHYDCAHCNMTKWLFREVTTYSQKMCFYHFRAKVRMEESYLRVAFIQTFTGVLFQEWIQSLKWKLWNKNQLSLMLIIKWHFCMTWRPIYHKITECFRYLDWIFVKWERWLFLGSLLANF